MEKFYRVVLLGRTHTVQINDSTPHRHRRAFVAAWVAARVLMQSVNDVASITRSKVSGKRHCYNVRFSNGIVMNNVLVEQKTKKEGRNHGGQY